MAAVYAEPDKKTFEYIFHVPVFSKEIRGNFPAWDNIIMMEGELRTFSEYPQEERVSFWTKGLEAIAKHIAR